MPRLRTVSTLDPGLEARQARPSYVDPRVIDLYEADTTVAAVLARLAKDQDKARDQLDRAVVKLLTD